MAIYEKYTGRSRDSFTSLEELRHEYKITYPDDFNFAYDVIDELARTKPEKLAMLWLSDKKEEKRFTFKDLSILSNKAANYFTSLGIQKGDKVLLVLKRSYWFWVVMLAFHKIGAIPIQATNMLKEKDYVYRCNSAGNKAVIITADGDCTEIFDRALPKCPLVKLRFINKGVKRKGWLDLEAGIEAASDSWQRPQGEKAIKVTDTMLMIFSSGTQGNPKLFSHDFAYPFGHIMTGVYWHRVEDGGLHFTIADTGWGKSLWGKFYGQWFGETALLVYDFDRFHAKDILQILEKYRVTTFCVPPTMYRLLLQEDVSFYDLKSIKHCCSAGEALNAEIFNKWKLNTGLDIYEGFGQTETPVCIGTLAPFSKPVPGTIGRPMPGFDIDLVAPSGKLCGAGEVGEICIRATPTNKPCGLISGYANDEYENSRAWSNGYYHTGDIAYMDKDGLITYVGRNDDVIKSSGYRIGPFEVESVLMEHPAVSEVAVTGSPDPVRGFVVKATIVLHKDFTPSDSLILELQEYVKKNTAPYKYPRIIDFVDELPKTFSGKIRRIEIRKRNLEEYNKTKGT